MRKIFYSLAIIFGILLTGSLSIQESYAGECYAPNPEKNFKEADVVFSGTVIKIVEGPDYFTAVTFNVSETLKGKTKEIMIVNSNSDVINCGIKFYTNVSYLVYVDEVNDRFFTDSNDGTRTFVGYSLSQKGTSDELTRQDAIEKCEVGRYGSHYTLGSYFIQVNRLDNDRCYMMISWEIEGAYVTEFCSPTMDSFKTSDWNNAFHPLIIDREKSMSNPCHIIKEGSAFFEEYTVHLSPLKQQRIGMISYDVVCEMGFELVFKSSNGHSVCVAPGTTEKLVQRGWASQ